MEDNAQAYLTGKLLLAMPSVGDPRFSRAVIYMCAHDENGAMGLVINQSVSGIKFRSVLAQFEISSDIQVDFSKLPDAVLSGGPVEPARGFLLHSADFLQDQTICVDERFSVTGTVDALKKIAEGQGPERFLFILGYAGWSAGQLEEEIRQNAWLVCEPDPDLVFQADMGAKWDKAVATLGFDPRMLSGEAGRA